MSADVQSLKAAVDCRDLAREIGDLDRNNKRLCLFHNEKTPSLQIYKDGYKCFGCGAHGDAVDWLEQVHNLSTAEAIRELERRAGGYVPPVIARPVKASRPAPTFKPVSNSTLKQHTRAAERLHYMPEAITGRGFTMADLRRFGFTAEGINTVFLVTGPDGAVLALKRRVANPGRGSRYFYTTPGHGTPAWCSPDFRKPEAVLVVEGELNAMACYLAAPELAVMGTAGTGGALHLDALEGRVVYVYADGDDVGQKARDKWATEAQGAGAAEVFVLEPWNADACDLAGRSGRAALRAALTEGLKIAKSFRALESFDAPNTALKDLRLSQGKPYLGFSGSRFSSKPKIGGKPCL